jgi:hypothetical protein
MDRLPSGSKEPRLGAECEARKHQEGEAGKPSLLGLNLQPPCACFEPACFLRVSPCPADLSRRSLNEDGSFNQGGCASSEHSERVVRSVFSVFIRVPFLFAFLASRQRLTRLWRADKLWGEMSVVVFADTKKRVDDRSLEVYKQNVT